MVKMFTAKGDHHHRVVWCFGVHGNFQLGAVLFIATIIGQYQIQVINQ
jgi:hypothetical protein